MANQSITLHSQHIRIYHSRTFGGRVSIQCAAFQTEIEPGQAWQLGVMLLQAARDAMDIKGDECNPVPPAPKS